jgi:hypothetical protein
MARPTKLTPELLEKARGYLATCKDEPVYTDKGALTYVNVNLPSKVGLAIYLEINKDTIEEWCKVTITDEEKETYKNGLTIAQIDDAVKTKIEMAHEFSVIVKEIMQEQEKRLINNGLGGLYKEKTNAMLLSKHGYVTEKTETDLTSGGEKIQGATVLPELIAEADRLLKEKKLNG